MLFFCAKANTKGSCATATQPVRVPSVKMLARKKPAYSRLIKVDRKYKESARLRSPVQSAREAASSAGRSTRGHAAACVGKRRALALHFSLEALRRKGKDCGCRRMGLSSLSAGKRRYRGYGGDVSDAQVRGAENGRLSTPSGPEEGYQARKAGQSIEGDKDDEEEVDMGTPAIRRWKWVLRWRWICWLWYCLQWKHMSTWFWSSCNL